MNGSGMASVIRSVAKVSSGGAAQGKQQEKERSGASELALGRPKQSGDENKEAMPEWKLKCLCTEYTIPLTMRGSLGCF